MIKKLLGLFLLFFLSIGGVWGQLNANFSSNPLYNSSNQLNVCAGSTVLLTYISTGSNSSATTTVSWTFTTNSGTALAISSSTLRTPFPVTFPNGNYTVQLTLSEPTGVSSTKTITVNATSTPPSTPSLSLSSFSVSNGWSSTTIAGVPAFRICPPNLNINQDVTFDISPTLNCSQVNSITHSEVPSSSPIDCNNGNIDVVYNPNTARFYYSVFTVQFSGCTFSRVYYVQIGTPSIAITSASSTACDPGTYTLAFTDQSPGVTYQIDWDYNGSSFNSQTVFSYPNLPIFPQGVSNTYAFTPCLNNTVQPNEILIRATNTCSGFSETNPSDVYVSQAPDANFNRSPNLDKICVGTQVTYTDNSYSGVYVNTSGNCSPNYHRWWTHSPAAFGSTTSNTSNVSNLGTSSTSNPGPGSFTVTYNEPGNYTIRLIVKSNSCGNDTIIKTVCVVPAVQANFNPSVTNGCMPLAVSTTNNSSLPGCTGTTMLYNWSVSNAPATCGTPAWNFTNNSNSNSTTPQFNFSGPGVYTVRLIASLNPSVPGVQCQNDTLTQTITVKGPPVVDITTPAAICQGQSFTPQATVNSCYTSTPTYAWSFSNGSPLTSNVLNPGSINYLNNGNFNFSLTATNECGTTTGNSTITVNQSATVTPGTYAVECSGNSIQLAGNVTGGATGGTWSSSGGGTFQPNANTLSATFIPPSGATGNITLTLTANGIIAPCPAVSQTATINLNATPFVNAGNDTSICAGANVLLNGTIGGTATSATWSTLGSGSFANINGLNTTYSPSTLDISNGTVALVLTTNDPAGPCLATKDTVQITIKPIPGLTFGTIQSVCSGNAFSIPLIPSLNSPPASYTWSLIAPSPLPSGVTTTLSGSLPAPTSSFSGTATNLTNNPVQLQYGIIPIVNGCSGSPSNALVTINPLPQPLITPPGPTTACNGTTVTLTTSVYSSYLWSNGGTGQSITVSAAGNYSVSVTNSYGCAGSSAVSNVNFSVPINPTFDQISPICFNGTFSLPTTSTNGISGTWSPAINNQATTTYTFTPSTGQCANNATMTVVVNPLPTPTVSANGPLTFCQGSSVILTATGGTSYVWYQNGTAVPGGTSNTLTVTQAGDYTVTVTNSNGCAATSGIQTVVVNLNPQPTIVPAGPVTNCQGTPLIISTGSNFSTYAWFLGSSTSTLGGNDSLSITTAGSYTVSVTNSNGCTGISAPFVFQTTPPLTPTFNTIAPICAGGTFTLQNTSLNGISGFWSPSPNYNTTTLYTFTPLTGSCANTFSMTVIVNPQPTILANGSTICSGTNATITAQPSLTGGTYSWSNGPTTQAINVNPITNTTYTVNYTLNGCVATDTAQILIVQTPTVTIPPVTICQGQAAALIATAIPTGGTYLWNNNQTLSSISVSPSANTTYTLTYSVNGCQSLQSSVLVTVNPIPTASLSSTAVCAGQNTLLTPTVSPSGGTYAWSTSQSTPSITVIPTVTTNYSLVYTFNGCASSPASGTVTVTPLPVITAPNATICSGQSTTLTSTVDIPGGTYVWSPNTALSSNNVASPVANPNNTQQYTVTYTANGCNSLPDTVLVSVIQNIQATVNDAIICNGASATLTANPANASYLWSNGSTSQSISVNPNSIQTYSVTVSAAGCPSSSANATVTVNPIPSVTVANVAAICNGTPTTLTATPSAPGGTYLWSNGLSGATINVTPALTNPTLAQNFNYSVVYTLNGCPSIADTVTVAVNPVPTVSFNDTTICAGNTATLIGTPNILGGNYLWNTGAVTEQITVSPSVTTEYTLIYNLNGCNDTIIDSVYVNPVPTVQINQNPTICYGETTTLTATVSPSNGTYLWTGYGLSGVNNQNQISISPQNGNSSQNTIHPYELVYTLNGCSDTAFTNINVNLIPSVIGIASEDTICPGQSIQLTGTGTPTISNGNTGTYVWYTTNPIDTIGNSAVVTVNPTVNITYEVVYTMNGCVSPAYPVSIVIQTAPQITIQNNPNTTICEGGCVTLSAVPSASTIVPSSYSWSTGETTQSIIVCPTDTATYTVIGLSGTCQSPVATTVVNVTGDPTFATAIIPDTTICVGGSYTFNIAVAGGVGTPTYSWYLNNVPNNSGGAALPNTNFSSYSTPTIIQPTTQYYYAMVTYPGVGCDHLVSPIAELNVISDPVVTIDPLFSQTLCEGGIADCIVPEVFGGIGNTTYLWIPSMTADSVFCPPTNQLGTQNYNVLVQQSGIGCGSLPSNSISITVIADPTIQIVGTSNVCMGAEVPLVTTVQGGIGSPANYQWSNSYPNGNPYVDIIGANGFNYTTIALNDQISIAVNMNQTGVGCNATDTFNINVFDDPVVTLVGDSMTCIGLTNNLEALVTGGVPNSTNTFTWFNTGSLINPTPIIVQGASLLNQYVPTIMSDTTYYVVVDNSGFGCDNDTSALWNIDAIEWAIANFDIDPEIPAQSIITPTFSFINTSQNSTNYFWDLGECDPQLPMSELFSTPSASYNPYSEDQINYTYGCSPGYYSVTLYAYNQGMCPDTVTQIIRIKDEVIVYVPNAFTPGDLDTFNQSFYPVITGKIKPGTYRFSIYDRWGELIFESSDPSEKWDGTYYKNFIARSGAMDKTDPYVQDGIYIWKLTFIAEETGDKIDRVGHVTKLKSDKNN